MSHRSRELVILIALPCRGERIHDRVFDGMGVEILLLHEIEVACGQSATGRPAIAPRGKRLTLGVRKALLKTLARAGAVGLDVIPPAIAQIGLEVLHRA